MAAHSFQVPGQFEDALAQADSQLWVACRGDGTLRVRVATPAWASELRLMTPQILARVNNGRSGRITSIRWMA